MVFMKISDFDRKEYENIPMYPIGTGNNYEAPIFIYKYSSSKHSTLSPKHRHNVIQINYVYHGKITHQVNNANYSLVKGDIFVIPPYVPHQLIQTEDSDYEIIELEFQPEFVFGTEPNSYHAIEDGRSVFDFSYIQPFLVSECNVRPRLNLTGKNLIIVESLIAEIYDEFIEKRDSYLLALKADLLKLLVIVGRAFHEELKDSTDLHLFNNHHHAMLQTIKYIDEHFNEPLTIEEVSKNALLSQSYFSYLFKTLTNKTFIEYLNELRIKKAMGMLINTNDRVLDICLDSGFNNINHFNRTFKAIVGVSPTQYRSSNRLKSRQDDH